MTNNYTSYSIFHAGRYFKYQGFDTIMGKLTFLWISNDENSDEYEVIELYEPVLEDMNYIIKTDTCRILLV